MEAVDAGDFVRIRSGRHQGKTGVVKRKSEGSNRPTAYYVFVPSEQSEYRFGNRELEKIDQLPGEPPLIERG